MKFSRFVASAALLPLVAGSSSALVIRNFDPVIHFRFSGYPASPQINPTFLNAGGNPANLMDFTGVGWSNQDTNRQLTLVSPRHFVGANHYRPAVGSQIVFLAPGNTVYGFTISKISSLPNDDNSASDLYLGELAEDVPVSLGIHPLPYLNLLNEAAYSGESILVFGRAARGGRGTIASVADFGGDPITTGAGVKTRAFSFTYNSTFGGADDCFCEGGDSGSPSFAVRSGRPAIVGTHTAVLTAFGTTTNYDSLVPHYVPVLNPLMETAGYHMIKITPAATSFAATAIPPSTVLRVLKPFTLSVNLTNGSAAAENVSVSSQQASLVAPGWIAGDSGSLRRGGVDAGASNILTLSSVGLAAAGPAIVPMTVVSDGSGTQVFEFQVTVLPSFQGWADGLADNSLGGDSDSDGIPNLLEYAFGGANRSASQSFPAVSAQPLLPFLANTTSISFIRRTDRAQRGLSYTVETSSSLTANSWQPLENQTASVVSNPADGFESVAVPLPPAAVGRCFYRLRVELSE